MESAEALEWRRDRSRTLFPRKIGSGAGSPGAILDNRVTSARDHAKYQDCRSTVTTSDLLLSNFIKVGACLPGIQCERLRTGGPPGTAD
jgi:hypothetical protein